MNELLVRMLLELGVPVDLSISEMIDRTLKIYNDNSYKVGDLSHLSRYEDRIILELEKGDSEQILAQVAGMALAMKKVVEIKKRGGRYG